MVGHRTLLIIIATIIFGAGTFLRKVALTNLHPLQVEAVSAIVHVAFIVPCIWTFHTMMPEGVWDRPGMLWAVLAAVTGCVAAIILMYALRMSNDAGTVSALVGSAPAVTLALSALFLGERVTPTSLIGIAFIIGGVVLIGR